jgi:DNA-binding IclR family transcriptional regulator
VKTPIYIGNREPLHNTAVGKAILAHKPWEEVESFLEELETVREEGISLPASVSLSPALRTVTAFDSSPTLRILLGCSVQSE